MKHFSEKLMGWNFKKILLGFVALVAVGGILGGSLLYLNFRPRAEGWRQEIITYRQEAAQRYEESLGEKTITYESDWDRGCGSRRMGGHHGYSAYYGTDGHRGMGELAGRLGITPMDKALVMGVGATALLLAVAARLLLSLWIAQKALKAGINPVLWGLLTLAFCLWGAVAFFIYRSFQHRCPTCGKGQKKDAVHCTNCGTALQETCKNCGNSMNTGDKYCGNCGHSRD